MRVTITLGEKALEFVTGIPEEELPEILSDVLERSLKSQVKSIENIIVEKEDNNEYLLSKFKEMMVDILNSQPSNSSSEDIKSIKSNTKKVILKKTKESSNDINDFDVFNLLK
jgi:hypothetical protein